MPVQEALAFAGVQQRAVAPPKPVPPPAPAKPDAPKAGGVNNISAREVSSSGMLGWCTSAEHLESRPVWQFHRPQLSGKSGHIPMLKSNFPKVVETWGEGRVLARSISLSGSLVVLSGDNAVVKHCRLGDILGTLHAVVAVRPVQYSTPGH